MSGTCLRQVAYHQKQYNIKGMAHRMGLHLVPYTHELTKLCKMLGFCSDVLLPCLVYYQYHISVNADDESPTIIVIYWVNLDWPSIYQQGELTKIYDYLAWPAPRLPVLQAIMSDMDN